MVQTAATSCHSQSDKPTACAELESTSCQSATPRKNTESPPHGSGKRRAEPTAPSYPDRHRHPRVLQLVPVVPQHMFSQQHASRPQLASASRLQIFVEFEWLVEETCEVHFCCPGRTVFRKGRKVLAEFKRG